jgi:hypothetical protein
VWSPVFAAPACSFTGCYDVTRTYSSLSQFAGILAGFAFAALITLLGAVVVTRQAFEARLGELGAFVGTLLLASLGLGFATYNYLFLGGEEVTRGRALSEGFLADATMTVATMLLPLAVLQLIEFADLDRWVPHLRECIVILPIFYYFVLVPDASYLQDSRVVGGGMGMPLSIAYGLVLLIVAIGLAGGWRRRCHWRSHTLRLSVPVYMLVAVMTLGLQLINSQSPDYVLPGAVVAAVYFVVAFAFGCLIAFILSTRSAKEHFNRDVTEHTDVDTEVVE